MTESKGDLFKAGLSKSELLNSGLFNSGSWLICPSNFFDVRYEINPWMSLKVTPQVELANRQWQTLHHYLLRLGAWVEYIQPSKDFPDLVFTANAGLIKGKTCVLSSFAVKERQGEEALYQKWFELNGFSIKRIKQGYFEGEGDALFAGDKLFCGYGFRSTADAYPSVAEFLNVNETILCKMVDPRFYHLDTCFAPLNEKLAIFYPAAFDAETIKRMEQDIELIAVDKADAEKFVCNAVVLGNNIIMPAKCEHTYQVLKQRGFTCYGIELGEFLKGGGSAKCLTLKLNRD